MADDFVAAFAGRVGGVLALPVKVRVIDPVVYVLVLVSPGLQTEFQVTCAFNRTFN